MSVVRRFYPEVRLKKMLGEAGGLRAGQALAAATERLEEIREDCLQAVDDKIAGIAVLAREGGAENLERCYYVANEIYAEAGAFGLLELSAAAHSLCSLLSAPQAASAAAIKVHVDTMRALRSAEMANNGPLRTAVLNELKALTARLTAAKPG
jgi:hypothetical protein